MENLYLAHRCTNDVLRVASSPDSALDHACKQAHLCGSRKGSVCLEDLAARLLSPPGAWWCGLGWLRGVGQSHLSS